MSQHMQCPHCGNYKVSDSQGYSLAQRRPMGTIVGGFMLVVGLFAGFSSQDFGTGIATFFVFGIVALGAFGWAFNPPSEYMCHICGYRWKP